MPKKIEIMQLYKLFYIVSTKTYGYRIETNDLDADIQTYLIGYLFGYSDNDIMAYLYE